MPTYRRPGTYVNETLLQQVTPANGSQAVGALVAAAPRGPVVPTVCNGWADVMRNYGNFTGVPASDVLLQAFYDAFQAGARTVVGVRAVGAGALAATLPFNLSTAATAAVNINAANPGAWGNNIYVEIVAGSSATYSTVNVRLVPVGTAVLTPQQIVERFVDVSLNPADPRYIVNVINTQNGGSAYITATPVGAYVYTANDTLAVTAAGGSKLAAGADGGGVASATLINAFYLLDAIVSPLVINLPGVTDAPTITALANYCDPNFVRTDGQPGRGTCFGIVDTPVGSDAPTAIALKATYPQSDCLAVYYPPIVVPDPTTSVNGATKLVPSGPSVLGVYLNTDATRGYFKAPAGVNDGLLRSALGFDPAATLKNPNLDALNDANVNAIKSVPGVGICVYGARTLQVNVVTRYVNARRTLIQVRQDLLDATAFSAFENNDSFLWGHLASNADKVLRDLYSLGGLKGATAAQAYFVLCDETNNSQASVDAGIVNLQVGVALQRPAEYVIINIGQFQGGGATATVLV